MPGTYQHSDCGKQWAFCSNPTIPSMKIPLLPWQHVHRGTRTRGSLASTLWPTPNSCQTVFPSCSPFPMKAYRPQAVGSPQDRRIQRTHSCSAPVFLSPGSHPLFHRKHSFWTEDLGIPLWIDFLLPACLLCVFLLKTGFFCVALDVLELAVKTRLTSTPRDLPASDS